MPDEEPLGVTLAKGALAGVIATGAMVAVRDALWKAEGEALREREKQLREGMEQTGFQKPVRWTADRLDVPLDKEQEQRVGKAIAWALGIGGVVGYAAARRRWPQARAGHGSAFGAAVWLAEDETLLPALGLAHGPFAYPWQAHARGLAAHLAYGVTAETTLRALDAAT